MITDNWLRDPEDSYNNKTGYYGSECDGGFAEYAVLPAQKAVAVKLSLSDAELATFSCSLSTGEGMLSRASVTALDTVLVPGALGGVGGALVQLAKRRGARVIVLASEAKHDDVLVLGADRVLPRGPADLRGALGEEKITVVADVVGGDYWPTLIDILERGRRYTCSGAIARPMVEFDLRTFYLRDLTFTGSTVIDPEVMVNLITYIEAGEIKPALAAAYLLEELREAQAAFIAKQNTGNIVVTPWTCSDLSYEDHAYLCFSGGPAAGALVLAVWWSFEIRSFGRDAYQNRNRCWCHRLGRRHTVGAHICARTWARHSGGS